MVRPDVLRAAVETNPPLEGLTRRARLTFRPGTCQTLFTLRRADGRPHPAFRPTVVLPFQWRPGPHSDRLPARLLELASQAAKLLGVNGWGLHPPADLAADDLDLTGLDAVIRPGSAWAALAGGLALASAGGRPDAAVWATGAWRVNDGVVPVGRLAGKLRLAARRGATTVFVAEPQVEAARRLAPALAIEGLTAGTLRTEEALRGYVRRLDCKPPPPAVGDAAGFDRAVAYYRRQERGSLAAVEYYWEALLPAIIHRCRERLGRRLGDQRIAFAPTHLVTVFSGRPELVPLMAEVLGSVTDVLVLHTGGDPDPLFRRVTGRLAAAGKRVREAAFVNDDSQTVAIPAAVRGFAAEVPAGRVVLDLTPGTKRMQWLADRAVPAGGWRVYLGSESRNAAAEPRPGTEDVVPWVG